VIAGVGRRILRKTCEAFRKQGGTLTTQKKRQRGATLSQVKSGQKLSRLIRHRKKKNVMTNRVKQVWFPACDPFSVEGPTHHVIKSLVPTLGSPPKERMASYRSVAVIDPPWLFLLP